MTRRLQIRIMATIILVLLVFTGFFGYNKWLHSANAYPDTNTVIKSVTYGASDKQAIFQIRWKKELKPASAKIKENYLIEHVFPRKGKWLTAVDGKKTKIDLIQHFFDKLDPNKTGRVTQLAVPITPKQQNGDFYRVRVRNVEFKDGTKMDHVEYGVVNVSNYANFTKK